MGFSLAVTPDVFANSLSGSGASQVGIGTTTSAIQQSFTQGNITTTNNPLIFRLTAVGFTAWTRMGRLLTVEAGSFIWIKTVSSSDRARVLTGYPADATGTIVQSSPVDLQLDSGDQSPWWQQVPGSVHFRASEQTLRFTRNGNNLGSGPLLTCRWCPLLPLRFRRILRPSNRFTALSVYDTLGNAHTLSLYAVKTALPGEWAIHANVDGTTDQNVTLTTSTLTFNTSGSLVAGSGVVGASINLANVMNDLGQVNSAATPLAFNIDFTSSSRR